MASRERYELRRTAGGSPVRFVRKANDESVPDDTIQNDDELVLAVEPRMDYRLLAYLDTISGSATAGIKAAITIPSGGVITVGWQSGVTYGVLINTGMSTGTIPLAVNVRTPIFFSGTVSIATTAGNVQIQWAQAVLDGLNITVVSAGSYLELVPVR